jgi:hypothetical protein
MLGVRVPAPTVFISSPFEGYISIRHSRGRLVEIPGISRKINRLGPDIRNAIPLVQRVLGGS